LEWCTEEPVFEPTSFEVEDLQNKMQAGQLYIHIEGAVLYGCNLSVSYCPAPPA
jgi:hypothetical protein